MTSIGFALCFRIMSKHFKMYITITNIIGKKRIDLSYLIQGKEVAVISMFSDNFQYQIKEPVKVLLTTDKEKELPYGMFMGSELNTFLGRNLIITPPVVKGDIIVTNKLAGVTEVVISLDKLDNTDSLENRRLSNVLLTYHVTGFQEFTKCEPVTPQYKKFKNREFSSLTLRITDQKGNDITDGQGMTIVLNIG